MHTLILSWINTWHFFWIVTELIILVCWVQLCWDFFLVIFSGNHLVYSAILKKYPRIINKPRWHGTQGINGWWRQGWGKYVFLIKPKYFSRHIKLYLKMHNLNYSSRLSLKRLILIFQFQRYKVKRNFIFNYCLIVKD